MKHNCVQMLIFKQRSIRCTSFGSSPPLVLMKSLAGAEGAREIAAQLRARLNGGAAHDSAHLAPVQSLGLVSGVKHRPSKPPLQAGYPEHGKTEFLRLRRRAHFRKDEFVDFVGEREKETDTIVGTKASLCIVGWWWHNINCVSLSVHVPHSTLEDNFKNVD